MPDGILIDVRVLPVRGIGWRVTIPGERTTWFLRKAVAVRYAIGRSKELGGVSLRIHERDGTVGEERTYPRSADPFPPKG